MKSQKKEIIVVRHGENNKPDDGDLSKLFLTKQGIKRTRELAKTISSNVEISNKSLLVLSSKEERGNESGLLLSEIFATHAESVQNLSLESIGQNSEEAALDLLSFVGSLDAFAARVPNLVSPDILVIVVHRATIFEHYFHNIIDPTSFLRLPNKLTDQECLAIIDKTPEELKEDRGIDIISNESLGFSDALHFMLKIDNWADLNVNCGILKQTLTP